MSKGLFWNALFAKYLATCIEYESFVLFVHLEIN